MALLLLAKELLGSYSILNDGLGLSRNDFGIESIIKLLQNFQDMSIFMALCIGIVIDYFIHANVSNL